MSNSFLTLFRWIRLVDLIFFSLYNVHIRYSFIYSRIFIFSCFRSVCLHFASRRFPQSSWWCICRPRRERLVIIYSYLPSFSLFSPEREKESEREAQSSNPRSIASNTKLQQSGFPPPLPPPLSVRGGVGGGTEGHGGRGFVFRISLVLQESSLFTFLFCVFVLTDHVAHPTLKWVVS